jgi:hypothetical protein
VLIRDNLERIAEVAASFAASGEELVGVVPAEPAAGERAYLCAFRRQDGELTWLVLADSGEPVTGRALVRDAVSIVAMCELAEEHAGGGELDELHSRLVALRFTENPPGVEEAEEAVLALQRAIGGQPRLATPSHLDGVGAATRRLEQALGESARSPFTEAMKRAGAAVQALTADVEANYKTDLA